MANQLIDALGAVIPGAFVPMTLQTVAYTTATQSSAVGAKCNMVRVTVTTAAFVLAGSNPTATTVNARYIPPNVPTLFPVNEGDKLSVLQHAAGGSAYIEELR